MLLQIKSKQNQEAICFLPIHCAFTKRSKNLSEKIDTGLIRVSAILNRVWDTTSNPHSLKMAQKPWLTFLSVQTESSLSSEKNKCQARHSPWSKPIKLVERPNSVILILSCGAESSHTGFRRLPVS